MKQKQHLAHIAEIEGKRIDQTVREHSIQTAKYTAECLKSTGLYHTGYFSGLLHDCGKCKQAFTTFVESAHEGSPQLKGSVIHTFAAAKFIMQHYWENAESPYEKLACEILSIAISSHHGLYDIEDPTGMKKENGLAHRVDCDDEEIDYTESMENFYQEVADETAIDQYYKKTMEEMVPLLKRIRQEYTDTSLFFVITMLTRLITSAVIDGDRRDTAEFMEGKKFELMHADQTFWKTQIQYMEQKLKGFKSDTPLNKVRMDISDQCKASAKEKGAIYRLNVPTGGGKTLASLRYALAHAAEYNKERIIYIIPLLSILDQNVQELHKYIKDDQFILEHHSNMVKTAESPEELDKRELLTETWDAPIIVSTLVQLLNILFSHKTTAIRRMDSLCNSVIIIDEVQSLPLKFSELFNVAMNFLAEYCGTTIILCSATQPAFEQLKWPIHLAEYPDLVKEKPEFQEIFKRVSVVNKITSEGLTLDQISEFAQENIEERDSLLIICNTKRTARELYKKMRLLKQDDWEIYHLSTSMCKKHRERVLSQVGKTPGLNENRKVICISTQLVEAGIDFSFESVIRIWAGLDSIVQAAGRCNRNNDWKKICPVYIVKLKNESLGSLEYIQQGQNTFASAVYEASMKGEPDYLSATFTESYFNRFYSTTYSEKEMRFNVEINKRKDFSVRSMLSANTYKDCEKHYTLGQAFRTGAENCKVFKDEKTDVIVAYDKTAEEHILNLTSADGEYAVQYIKKQLDQLKPYTVSLFQHELEQLRKDNKIDEKRFPGVIFLDKSAYTEDLGISIGEYFINDDISIL